MEIYGVTDIDDRAPGCFVIADPAEHAEREQRTERSKRPLPVDRRRLGFSAIHHGSPREIPGPERVGKEADTEELDVSREERGDR